MLANPPFGVDWKKVPRSRSTTSTRTSATRGRFGAGLPRVSDGSAAVPAAHDLQDEARRRTAPAAAGIAIVFSGSPTVHRRRRVAASRRSAAGSSRTTGSKAIVALPDQLFYNTGISHLLLGPHQPQGARPPRQGRAPRRPRRVRPRCARASATSASTSPTTRSTRSPACTRDALDRSRTRTTRGSRSSTTKAFGYQRITVERPLKLRFEVTDEALTRAGTDAQVRQDHLEVRGPRRSCSPRSRPW